tara:strand:- start:19507 stop:20103 length:597 start_codon:yes stop_codon:yes gene_type:complete
MVWPFNNNQPQTQTSAMNLGLAGGQQQMPMQGGFGGVQQQQFQQQQNPWGQQQYQPPPTEMEIISALISTNPAIDRWIATDKNLETIISLISSIVAVSVNQMLANCTIKEDGDSMKFDFSAVQGMPTADSVAMNMSQLQNSASNVVQQQSMQIQQMVAMANQGSMQNMLDGALADPGMIQSVGGGIGSLVRGMATGGR